MHATAKELHGAAGQADPLLSDFPPAGTYTKAEQRILRQIRMDSFTEEYHLLNIGKPVSSRSRLLCFAPQYGKDRHLIRVGGRLRWVENLDLTVIHPVVLDPSHPGTKLLIQDADSCLCHPGPQASIC